ncbi:C4-dicarboxylate transporter DctQ subunit [Pseudomonas sp. BIGb0408]|jgi:C4-dicarboxylate transporter, DctQ subunit|uniref:TRAP transporter small permease protein n=1 Tax=Phytopseudomonas flavescens TaxID=29435 RepID=A0A7Y9XPH0_9GAMM|nr:MULTISPECIES: TRAP transporter small permease [Pseudomonas]MCW2290337.1 C4-dicarboxylate transporter DctQ subunit [Pseudomonas sp. BIGb0408]NYH75090.1 C4-dicarboxylate transporter DctQ subunit [Pseudomonas flavescens]
MHAVARVWNQAEEVMVAFLLAGMTLVTFSYVVFNNLYGVFYALGDSLPFANDAMFSIGDGILYVAQEMTWSVALTKAMFGWLIFVGLAWGVRIGAHIGVDLLVRMFKPALQKTVAIIALIICLAYCALMAYSSEQWVAVLFNIGTGAEDLDRFGVQQWHIVMIVPIGFSLMFLRFAQVLVRVIQDKQIGFGGHGEVEDAIKLAEETEAKR